MKIANTISLHRMTIEDLYEISLASARANENVVYIYEKNDLSVLLGLERAELLRKEFLKNKITVKQITNIPELPPFSENDEFINSCMNFRYIPKETFLIENEVLVFDDVVAIYRTNPEFEMVVLQDEAFARNQKQLFNELWDQGQSPQLGFNYAPNHSLFKSIDYKVDGKHVVVYPDKDALDSYKGFDYESLGRYIEEIVHSNGEFYKDFAYLIIFIWNYEGHKMADVWKFDTNYVDDRSGPLGEAKIYKDGKECKDLGLASGNTLLVLGYEERLRRQSANIQAYFDGPPPSLPLEILNRADFFEVMKKDNN